MLPRIYGIDSNTRKRQITTLKVFNENVTEVAEDYEYRVLFSAGGTEFSIYVTLNSNFPNEKPILKIVPTVAHSWVNNDGEITSAPGLLNFTIHSDLGRVVQAIIREFQRTPPPLFDKTSKISPKMPSQDAESGRVSPIYQANFSGLNSFSPPKLPTPGTSHQGHSLAFPELNSLTLDELQFLNDSQARREEFMENLPQVREMSKNLDDLISQVEELVDSNLCKEERLAELKKGIDVRIEEITKLAFENERLHATYQNLSDKYAPRNIKEKLRLSAEKAESESEKIAESFLSGKLDVDKFVQLYLKKRTLCQTRKTKEEKFSQQLNSLAKAGF